MCLGLAHDLQARICAGHFYEADGLIGAVPQGGGAQTASFRLWDRRPVPRYEVMEEAFSCRNGVRVLTVGFCLRDEGSSLREVRAGYETQASPESETENGRRCYETAHGGQKCSPISGGP